MFDADCRSLVEKPGGQTMQQQRAFNNAQTLLSLQFP
jgi:hypothetical protein